MAATQITAAPPANGHTVLATIGWLLVVFLTYTILLALLAGPHFFGHEIKVGELAEQELVAPKKMLIVDQAQNQELQNGIRQTVSPVMKRNLSLASSIFAKSQTLLDRIEYCQKESILPDLVTLKLNPAEQAYLIACDNAEWKELTRALLAKKIIAVPSEAQSVSAKFKSPAFESHKSISNFIAETEQKRLKFNQIRTPDQQADDALLFISAAVPQNEIKVFRAGVEAALSRFLENVGLYPYTAKKQWQSEFFEFLSDKMQPVLRHKVAYLLASQFVVDMVIDKAATDKQIEQAITHIRPVMKEIDVGSVIVSKGKLLTEQDLQTLNSLGIKEVKEPMLALMIAVSLMAAFMLLGIFLYNYEPKIFFAPSSIALIGTLLIVTCGISLFVGKQFPQFVPLPAVTLILSVTYGRRVSAVLSILMIVFLKIAEIITGPYLVALGTASGMALGASIKKRNDLMLTGFLIGLMQMLGYFCAVIFGGSEGVQPNLGSELPLQILGGLSSAIVAIGSLPFLENIFGIVTPYRVAELSEPDQPLIRQLEENAPGTYQHSLAVANLAEGGARAIGADVNLVRTGAMYHDIGKMVTPRYFIENQLGDKNPHDFIPPEESRARVLAHVTNGLALAQKYNLPKTVQAFIPEHQGTTIMAYFYHKACLRDGTENVDPKFYRYPGPKPQSKESAIVMLADVSEAVTHSMKDPSQEEVEAAMSNVFKARWEDGQFNESQLTYEELEKVKKGFVRVWRTLHHDRLKYPSTTTGRMPIPPVAPSPPPAEQAVSESLPAVDSPDSGPDAGGCCG